MSGWIKLEKDLLSDPRVARLALFLSGCITMNTEPTKGEADGDGFNSCNGQPLPGTTVVLGVLAQLWMLADTHASEDDVLPLGVDEIDELIGIPGLCSLLPSEWLQVIDEYNVKLPGFHEHNGTVAKERALNARRQDRHRKSVTARRDKLVIPRNARPLPDQDLDQDLSQSESPTPIPLSSESNLKGPSSGQSSSQATQRAREPTEFKLEQADPSKANGKGPVEKRGTSRPTRRCPADWLPSSELLAQMRAECPGVDLERETAKFRDYTFSTARSDWDATWRNWMRKAAEDAEPRAKLKPTQTWRPPPDEEPDDAHH